MQILLLVLFVGVLLAGAYGYKVHRTNARQRARERRRNQFHDRV